MCQANAKMEFCIKNDRIVPINEVSYWSVFDYFFVYFQKALQCSEKARICKEPQE